MKSKKLVVLASALLMAITAFSAVGCGDNSNNGTPVTPIPSYTVSLPNETLLLTLGDQTTLLAEYDQQDGAEISFTSSDPSIVTVNEYGRVEALRVGTAIITVRYGEASDTCTVTVSMGNLLPALQLPNVPDGEITLNNSSELDLSGTVVFNEKTYDDVVLTYELSDETVGEIVDGVFKPLKAGSTEILVKGTWRGNAGESLTRTISVRVVESVNLLVNGGVNEITLYTETAEGCEIISPFEIQAEKNGQPFQPTVEVTKGSDLINYNAEAQTVESRGVVGAAEITLYYEIDGEPRELAIAITVKPTLYVYETVLENFSVIHGDVVNGTPLNEIFTEEILSACDKDGNALEVKENKVYGVPSSKDGKFQTEITIYSSTRGYVVQLEGYTGIITKAEDFAMFNINVKYSDGSFSAVDESKPAQVWDGYYVLANNIDASKYTHNCGGEGLASRGLQSGYPYGLYGGTFDGQGYTVKGMTIGAFGIFGYVSNGATIKNVAFVDVKLDNIDRATTIAQWIDQSTISNVYIGIAGGEYSGVKIVPFAGGINNSKLTACIVDIDENFVVKNSKTYGSFIYLHTEIIKESASKTVYSDVYVISKMILGYYNEASLFYAENKMPTTEGNESTEESTMKEYMLEGVFGYDTAAEMQAAGNAYSAFDSNFWNIENGMPVWKTLTDFAPAPDDSTTDKVQEAVGDFNVDWLN